MYYWDKVEEALKYIEKKTSVRPQAAVILGSGLGRAAKSIEAAEIIPYDEIPYWPRPTAPGHAGRLVLGRLGGKAVAAMQGRVHYYEGYNMQEVTFPMRVLASLGVRALVATNASGGVNLDFRPGTIAAITDHINFMGVNPLAGVNHDEWGVRFPDMTEAYDKKFIETLENAAREENIELKKGVYIAFSGPSFETPAEVRMARLMGADMVGMSTVPEVLTANHMGVRVLGISCAANYAAGITSEKLTQEDVLSVMENSGEALSRLIERFLSEAEI